MGFPRIASKRERRARLFGALLAVATALVALGFSWFQGFEIDTSHWFQDSSTAIVNRVQEPSTSTAYNANTFGGAGNFTSVYADPISAATDDFLGRVQSAVKTGHCYIDNAGAIGPSLRCEGPFTDFNLTPAFSVAAPFPSGGYTDQIDIYLDAAYAPNHRDCSTGPCNPRSDTPGVDPTAVNTACVPYSDKPSVVANCTLVNAGQQTYQCVQTTACEGSRFTWTVGLNDPTGNFHRDYVFQVGTLAAGQVAGCPDGGYSINAQYNSFRSGGNPYQGFNTKCIPTSGWYTFKQVFTKDASGNLQVDWSIADQATGNKTVCRDPAGNPDTPIDCTWSASRSDDSIDNEQIGCPSYGWLANEEINDLPIDNTKFETFGGDCGQPTERAQITPTDITCQQFRDSTATTLEALQYTLRTGKINSVSPGVFFYYSTVTGTTGDSVGISQHSVTPPGNISILKDQAIIYDSSTCTKVGKLTVTGGTASGQLPSTGSFIIGVKYNPSSLKGQKPPTGGTAAYTFDTEHPSGTEVVTAGIELEPKP